VAHSLHHLTHGISTRRTFHPAKTVTFRRTVATALRFGGAVEYMEPENKERLASLPERVTIYRGQLAARRAGISWTTDREVAEWFARRWAMMLGGEPELISGHVERSNVIAAFTGRNESEVLVLPRHVRDRAQELIPPAPQVVPSAWGEDAMTERGA
jgi:hypothetical protein